MSAPPPRLVLVFGVEQDRPDVLYDAVNEAEFLRLRDWLEHRFPDFDAESPITGGTVIW